MLEALPGVTVPSRSKTVGSLAKLFHRRAVTHRLVDLERHLVALDLDLDRDDLSLEVAMIDRGAGSAMAFHGQLVLILPRDLVLLGDVLGRDAHVAIVERIAERSDHHVDQRRVVHASPETHRGRGVGTAAHVLGTARHGHVGIAEHDRLGGRDDRLQPAAAQPVQRQRRCFVRQTTVHAGDACQVMVVSIRMDDVAEHDVADVVRLHAGPLDGLPHTFGRHHARRSVLQTSAISSDRRSHTTEHHHFTRHLTFSQNRLSLSPSAMPGAISPTCLALELEKRLVQGNSHTSSPPACSTAVD